MINTNPEVASEQCIPQETYISNVELARAYVPFEKLCRTYTPLGALIRGTAFPPLHEVSAWEPKKRMVYDDE